MVPLQQLQTRYWPNQSAGDTGRQPHARSLNPGGFELKDPYLPHTMVTPNSKDFNILYGNATAFSEKVKACIFCEDSLKRFDMVALLETHKDKTQNNNMESLFRNHHRRVALSPAESTGQGDNENHGGELVSCKTIYNFIPIEKRLIEQIEHDTGQQIRFAAGYLRFKDYSFLIITLYCRCSVNMNEDNNLRFKQIDVLVHITGLKFIIMGDMNMTKEVLEASGWPKFLNAMVRLPDGASTTLKRTANRIIDYILVSCDICAIVKSLKINLDAPFPDHFGLDLTLHSKPRQIFEPQVVQPLPLPWDIFTCKWNEYDEVQKQYCWDIAQTDAKTLLDAQKVRSGYAILGQPLQALIDDPKIQSHFNESIISGEKLAFASLSLEKLVLSVANISSESHKKYIGRGQFPHIINRSIVCKNTSKIYGTNDDLNIWSEFICHLD